MASSETTMLRISQALNERLKDALTSARNGMSVTKLAENLLNECLDCMQAATPLWPPTVQLLRSQSGRVMSNEPPSLYVDPGIDARLRTMETQLLRLTEEAAPYVASKKKKGQATRKNAA